MADTETTGSRLPADLIEGGQSPTGLGLEPDLEMMAGDNPPILAPRPVRAAANDAARVWGDIAEGQMNGETNPEKDIPWL